MNIDRLKELAARAFQRIKEEPVLLMTAIAMALNGLALIGLEVDPELVMQIDGVLVPVLALITRRAVSPVSKLRRLSPEDLARQFEG